MSTLYELHDDLQAAIAEHVDPETGEITEEGLEALAKVEMAFDQKALNIGAYIRSLQIKADGYKGEAESVKSHAAALDARKRACLNKAARLTDYIQMHLDDGRKMEDERVRISWGTATSLELKSPPESLPVWAQRVRDPEANKKALADALKDESGERFKEAMEHAYVNKRRYVRVK